MFAFSAAVFFLLITPGPGVLSTAGVGAAFGRTVGLRYLTGLFIGTNLVALAVVSGLAAIVLSLPWLRLTLLVLSALYLLSLAARIALSGSEIAFIKSAREPGIRNGILLQTINPKAYAVNTTLFSGFSLYADSIALETLIKFAIINAIWIPIHLLWLAAGISLKRLALNARTQRLINMAMAASMLIVVVLALLSAGKLSTT
jgi:threonine/homoserine/homoserine lactone efflux protein